jgi:diguanylate cyclase (GGDEF)-like protein/PAS domain S-box-containing protein
VIESDVALSALRMLPGGVVLAFDSDLRIILAAGTGLAHHGLDPDALEGQLAASVLEPDRWAIFEPLYRAALSGRSETVEVWSGDETRCYSVQVGPLPLGPRITGGLLIAEDITQRKHSDEARRHAQERFELVFERSPIGMALLTADGRPVRVNEALLQITGYTAQELLGKTLDELAHPDEPSTDQEQLRRLRAGELDSYQVDRSYLHARGHQISARLSVALVRDRQGKPLHFIAQIQDITEYRQIERRLGQLTERDPLTGLLSRKRLEQEVALLAADVYGGRENATLITIDLNDFRRVNDTHGHRVGDDLLKLIATELRRRLRGGDLIARLGNDEFAILLPDTPPQAAGVVARDLQRVIAGCALEVADGQIACTATIGMAGIAEDTEGSGAALLAAERAMRPGAGLTDLSPPVNG